MENEYTEYWVYGLKLKAKRSAGGKFYDIVFPNGEKHRVGAWAFEIHATPVKAEEVIE